MIRKLARCLIAFHLLNSLPAAEGQLMAPRPAIEGAKHLGGWFYDLGGEVYYYATGKCNGRECLIKLQGADQETFKIFTEYAKDKERVYYSDHLRSRALPGIDPRTFVELGQGLAKDESHLLVRDQDITALCLPGFKLNSFHLLSPFIGKDERRVYFLGRFYADSTPRRFEVASEDPLSFRVFFNDFAADSHAVWYRDFHDGEFHKLGEGMLDGGSFEIVARTPVLVVKDKHRVYQPQECNFFQSRSPLVPIEGLNPQHARLIGEDFHESYLVDDKKVYSLSSRCLWRLSDMTVEQVAK